MKLRKIIKPKAWANAFGEVSEVCDSGFRFPLFDEYAVKQYAAEQVAAEREAVATFVQGGDLTGIKDHPAWLRYTADLLNGLAAAIRARAQDTTAKGSL